MRTAKPALICFANEDCKARGAEWVDGYDPDLLPITLGTGAPIHDQRLARIRVTDGSPNDVCLTLALITC